MNPITELFELTQSVPQNASLKSHEREIQDLCETVIHSPQKSEYCLWYGMLQQRFNKLERNGSFTGTPLAKKAFQNLLAELSYTHIAQLIDKDPGAFKELALESPEEVFDNPAIRSRVLNHLALRRPELLFQFIDRIKPSLKETLLIAELIFRHHYNFIDKAVDMLRKQEGVDQRMLIELFMKIFPQQHVHNLSADFLELFILHNIGPEKYQELLDRFGDGICAGHAVALLGQKKPIPALVEPQARFLQAASELESDYQYTHLKVLGEELLNRRDELPVLFEKIRSIYGVTTLNNFPPDRIAACAKRLANDPEFQLKLHEELHTINEVIQQVEREIPTPEANEPSSSVLAKLGLHSHSYRYKNAPLSRFIQETQTIESGNFLLEIYNSKTKGGHALYLSLDQLSFCDINDCDPDTFLPIVRHFLSPKDLWAYVNAHIHIFYKSCEIDKFNIQSYQKEAP